MGIVFLYDVDVGGRGPPFQGEDFQLVLQVNMQLEKESRIECYTDRLPVDFESMVRSAS